MIYCVQYAICLDNSFLLYEMTWHEAHRFRISWFLYGVFQLRINCRPQLHTVLKRSLIVAHLNSFTWNRSIIYYYFSRSFKWNRCSLNECSVRSTLEQRKGGKTSTKLCDFQIALYWCRAYSWIPLWGEWASDNTLFFRWWMLNANKCMPSQRYSGVQSKIQNDFIANNTESIKDE